MMVRKTLQWIASILFLSSMAGGGYAYWFYNHCDMELQTEFLRIVGKRLPNAEVHIGRSRFDFGHRAHFYDVQLFAKGVADPLARIYEIVVTLDGQELSEDRKIDVRRIQFIRPDVLFIRGADGGWNWEKVLPFVKTEDASPEIDFENLQAILRLVRADGTTTSLHVQQADIHLVPSARREFTVQASVRFPGLGDAHLDGGFDIEKRTWQLRGNTVAAANIAETVDAGLPLFPDVVRRLAKLESAVVAATQVGVTPSGGSPAAGATFAGRANLHFELSHGEMSHGPGGRALDFRVRVDLEQAEVNHPLLPFPLQEISGTIFADNRSVIVKNVRAHNGGMQLVMHGELDLAAPTSGNRIDVAIQDLALDRRLQGWLPAPLRGLYDSLRPAGQVDAGGTIVRADDGQWKPVGWSVTYKGASVWHRKFPYPVTQIVGKAEQRGNALLLNLRGRAGERPIKLTGKVVNPGPDAVATYIVELDHLPINDTLMKAAAAIPALQRTLAILKLRGLLDVKCRFDRSAAPEQKVDCKLAVCLSDGSLEYDRFPYRIADLRGTASYDSTRGTWTFEDLQGSHGPADLSSSGSFVKRSPGDPGILHLEIHAEEAPLDNDLARAFPRATQRIWDLARPSGKLRTQVLLTWVPGRKPQLSVPEALITDGALEIKSFPYSLEHLTARFALGQDPVSLADQITLLAFEARHDETKVRLDNAHGALQSRILCPAPDDPVGEWEVRLEGLDVEDLVLDRALRHALPLPLRNTAKALNPQGKVSLKGIVDLRGTLRSTDRLTAAWNIETTLSGATISTGVELRSVQGLVHSRGIWDGLNVKMEGDVNLDSIFLLNHQFTEVRGPFELNNQELTIGAPEVFLPLPANGREEPIAREKRLTAKAVGGNIFLDAKVHLDAENAEKSSYRVKAAMSNASLDKYAQLHQLGPASLHGVMQGWIDLSGNSSDPRAVLGAGQLLISPAALYELPVFIQIFKQFRLTPTDKSAFNYALANFKVSDRRIAFSEIDLKGEALSLRGRGWTTFDGTLKLDFYSYQSLQRSAMAIPIVSDFIQEVWSQAMKGWVGVQVTGTVQNPHANYRAVPKVDDALRELLAGFNARPNGVPQLRPPWMIGSPLMMAPRPPSANPLQ